MAFEEGKEFVSEHKIEALTVLGMSVVIGALVTARHIRKASEMEQQDVSFDAPHSEDPSDNS